MLKRMASIVKALIPVLLGTSLGIGLTLLFMLNSSMALQQGVTIGLAVCVFCFTFFIIVRSIARNSKVVAKKTQENKQNRGDRELVLLFSSLLGRFAPDIENPKRAGEELASNAREFGKIGLSYWSAAAALGIAITAMGLVIAMVTAMAAINQVNRIDKQNSLIEQQIYEAQASRVSSLFSAQLPDIIAAIDFERSGRDEWVPSDLLVNRIQAIVDVAEPYLIDSEVEGIRQRLHHGLSSADMNTRTWHNQTYTIEPLLSEEPLTFSPERGQLLRIVISSGMQLSEIEQPLNFSRAYLRGATLSGASSLGETDLSLANLLDSRIAVDLGSANLTGAFLPPLNSLYWRLPFPKDPLSEEDGKQFPRIDYAVTWDTMLARVNFLLELPLDAGTFDSFSGYEPGTRTGLDMSDISTLEDLTERVAEKIGIARTLSFANGLPFLSVFAHTDPTIGPVYLMFDAGWPEYSYNDAIQVLQLRSQEHQECAVVSFEILYLREYDAFLRGDGFRVASELDSFRDSVPEAYRGCVFDTLPPQSIPPRLNLGVYFEPLPVE